MIIMQRANSAVNGFEHMPTTKKRERKVMSAVDTRISSTKSKSDTSPLSATGGRLYLPTLSDLVDRLTIVQQKMIWIPERAKEYAEERDLILHDIDLILADGSRVNAHAILAVVLISISNRVIWENESQARKGGSEQDKLLKFTHSINGVRNTAKNLLAQEMGGRHDYKVDCFSAQFGEAYGNWNVFKGIVNGDADDFGFNGGAKKPAL
jgi:hypothetical protein